ncbi:MAG: tRNA uridine-5-carboxymethylaminomethyl(34) synthesis GTPase MnmE [Candidatus Acetothermia bacterium]
MYSPDTISAISTPLGKSGIGIVRLSGPEAIAITGELFRSPREVDLAEVKTHTLHYGFIYDPEKGRRVDEVLVSVMNAPSTYTREDVVEINCHGGVVPLRETLELTHAHGARPAEPGEFTRRAFLNGRITLDQAKSVKDLVDAKTQLSLELAVERLEGRFSGFLSRVREELTSILAEIEVAIDFPDYESSLTPHDELREKLVQLKGEIDDFLESSRDGKILREGHRVAILGKPNVGKSTLLNRLLKEERAIVSPTPGTTRDTIEEEIEINGIPLAVTDTAGIRQPENEIEERGVARAKEQSKTSDLALFLVDVTENPESEDQEISEELDHQKSILLLNKSDLDGNLSRSELVDKMGEDWADVIAISAKTGTGMRELEDSITRLIWGGKIEKDESLVLLDVQEKDLLRKADEDLADALETIDGGRPVDLVEVHLRDAREKLGRLMGEDVSDKILDRIFADFCVGK